MDVDAAVLERYGLPPEQFTAARNELAKTVKASGTCRAARRLAPVDLGGCGTPPGWRHSCGRCGASNRSFAARTRQKSGYSPAQHHPTLVERRPPWSENLEPDWTTSATARQLQRRGQVLDVAIYGGHPVGDVEEFGQVPGLGVQTFSHIAGVDVDNVGELIIDH